MKKILTLILLSIVPIVNNPVKGQEGGPELHFIVSIPQPAAHYYHVEFNIRGIDKDTLILKMPKWMPGYYQLMDYAENVENISAQDAMGHKIPLKKINGNTWAINGIRKIPVTVRYDIKTPRKFVANSYVDSAHAYIAPANTFLYIDGYLDVPVTIEIETEPEWNEIATGLEIVSGSTNRFTASDYDILYDCPILIGNLEELPTFKVNGIEHHFIGYKIGSFDKEQFISYLKMAVETAVGIIGDIPYKEYTFIGIGPGRGGIEHLNNTTISFDGNRLTSKESMNRILAFIAHEYFHHYNVKRIRPIELGPFDYDMENRTNQLWVSEGLTVYYEYLILRRAGLIDEKTLFSFLEGNINAFENDPGRTHQSLQQASYSTWEDGPFGKQGNESDRSISYYDKGPIVGLLMDFEIRNATQNQGSLDDVMRLLYERYYKKEQRGFTDAEFQEACESVAGISLSNVFEYVFTTNELDYEKYLNYAGLKTDKQESAKEDEGTTTQVTISRQEKLDNNQYAILSSWQGE